MCHVTCRDILRWEFLRSFFLLFFSPPSYAGRLIDGPHLFLRSVQTPLDRRLTPFYEYPVDPCKLSKELPSEISPKTQPTFFNLSLQRAF